MKRKIIHLPRKNAMSTTVPITNNSPDATVSVTINGGTPTIVLPGHTQTVTAPASATIAVEVAAQGGLGGGHGE